MKTALAAILRDEALHRRFHEARLARVLASGGVLRRLGLRTAQLVARRILVTSDRSVAPPDIYRVAMGVPFSDFRRILIRECDKAYSGPLADLRV